MTRHLQRLLAKVEATGHELAECSRLIEALHLQIALAGDEAATQRFHNRMLELDRRYDAFVLTRAIRICVQSSYPMRRPA